MPDEKKQVKRRKVRVSVKELEYFTENLGMLLRAAVPIGEALESLGTSVQSRAFKKAISGMQQDIEAGYTLSDTLERSGVVGQQTLALVRMGEVSGNLTENLAIAAQQEQKRRLFVAKVRSALLYPSFVLSVTLVVGLGVAWFLLPRLAETFKQLNVALPPISKVMIDFGLFLKEYGVIAVPVALLMMALLIYIFFFAPGTRRVGQSFLLHVPGIGRLMKEVEIAQFGYLLGTLLQAGLSVTQSLQLLQITSTSPLYRGLYRHLSHSIDEGYTFKDALARDKKSRLALPPPVQQMIIAGERSGSLPLVLASIGKTYEQKSDTTTRNLETIIEPVLLVIVAVGVVLVAIAVIMPIYSLMGQLNSV